MRCSEPGGIAARLQSARLVAAVAELLSLGDMRGHTFMKWEYTTVIFETSTWIFAGKLDGQKFNERLNRLGEEGWELVSTFGTSLTEGATRDVIAVFKRPMK